MTWWRRRYPLPPPVVEQRQALIDLARLRVACHESTHAVIALLLGRPVGEIRIGSRFGDAGGAFRGRVDPKRTSADDNKLRENLGFIAKGLTGYQVFDHLIELLGPLAFEAGHELPNYFVTCEDDMLLARTIA